MKKRIMSLVLALALVLTILPISSNEVKAAVTITGLQQVDAERRSVSISWDVLPGHRWYFYQLSTDGKIWSTAGEVYGASATINDLKPGKSYWTRVSFEGGSWTAPIEVSTIPEEVGNLRQSKATTSSITLSWSASEGATKYKVCQWVNDQEFVLGTTSETSYTISGFSNMKDIPYNIYVKPLRSISTGYTAGLKANGYYWYDSYIRNYNLTLIPKKMVAPKIETTSGGSTYVYADRESSVPFAKGYEYELYTVKGKKVSSGDFTGGYVSLDNLNSKQFYKVRFRAYTYLGKTKTPQYGAWSDYTTFAISPSTLHITSAKKGKALRVSWGKNKNATSYTIYGSTHRKGKFKKIATTKKTSYVVKKVGKSKIKKNKNYYFYVKANKKQGKKTIKSINKFTYYSYIW